MLCHERAANRGMLQTGLNHIQIVEGPAVKSRTIEQGIRAQNLVSAVDYHADSMENKLVSCSGSMPGLLDNEQRPNGILVMCLACVWRPDYDGGLP